MKDFHYGDTRPSLAGHTYDLLETEDTTLENDNPQIYPSDGVTEYSSADTYYDDNGEIKAKIIEEAQRQIINAQSNLQYPVPIERDGPDAALGM